MPIPGSLVDPAKIFSQLYLAVIKTNDGAGVLVARLLSAALWPSLLYLSTKHHPPPAAAAHIPPTVFVFVFVFASVLYLYLYLYLQLCPSLLYLHQATPTSSTSSCPHSTRWLRCSFSTHPPKKIEQKKMSTAHHQQQLPTFHPLAAAKSCWHQKPTVFLQPDSDSHLMLYVLWRLKSLTRCQKTFGFVPFFSDPVGDQVTT